MKGFKWMIVIVLVMGLLFVGCTKKDDDSTTGSKAKTIAELNNINQEMTDVSSTEGVEALTYGNLGDLPFLPEEEYDTKGNINYLKNIPLFSNMLNVTNGDFDFYNNTGTWEFNDETYEWEHVSDEPTDKILVIFSYPDPETGVTHNGELTFYDYSEDSYGFMTSLKIDMYVDNSKVAWLYMTLENSADGAIVSMTAEGGLTPYSYVISISNTTFLFQFKENGEVIYSIETHGTYNVAADEYDITYIKFTYKHLAIIIDYDGSDNPPDGTDIGDVQYDNEKVADLIVHYEEEDGDQVAYIYIKFREDGQEVLLSNYLTFIDSLYGE